MSFAPFPMLTVRNPWAFLIQKGFKKIENRNTALGAEFRNTWIALHVSKTFASREDKFAHQYLPKHEELLISTAHNDSNSHTNQALAKYWGKTMTLSTQQKIDRLITSALKPQLGHIIGFFKVSKCFGSKKAAMIHDALYTDDSYRSHWLISDVVELTSSEYLACRGHMGVKYISDKLLNDRLQQILALKLQHRQASAASRKNKKKQDDNTKPASDEDDDEDDDLLAMMSYLERDGVLTQSCTQPSSSSSSSTSQCKKRKLSVHDCVQTSFDAPSTKKMRTSTNGGLNGARAPQLKLTPVQNATLESKRKLPHFMQSNHTAHSDNDKFNKLSKQNSYSTFKQEVISTVSTNTSGDGLHDALCDANNDDIDRTLQSYCEHREQQQQRNEQQHQQHIMRKLDARINQNPIEIARKSCYMLPDEYQHRVIVFDTEVATFKPAGSIIDLAGVELINGKLTGRSFQCYVKPWTKIHPESYKVHGLSQDFLDRHADGDIYHAVQMFMEWITSNCVCSQCVKLSSSSSSSGHQRMHTMKLVAHNAMFDVRQLNAAIDYCQSKMPASQRIWQHISTEQVFDTMTYFRHVMKQTCYSEDDMCRVFGISTKWHRKNAHSAIGDCKLLAQCLQAMWKRDKSVQDSQCSNRFFKKKLT
eukprot:CAMPEP_0202702194 /NCGR_PEP_ID=MMETSP1385-20130828/15222_1 /ASSEMBLY_ACC=CAM_ASM_000861 /TAXON_ID=933848 /ORGANISM="Elphidium margaritaceum" /LENGTH=645 /DNA_ID=CAMNT_0049359803 /DNA_START=38 /DNA_END=1975 /DNA_ORIENTATION=-